MRLQCCSRGLRELRSTSEQYRTRQQVTGTPTDGLPEGDGVGPQIAAATQRVLRPGGAFLVYQFSPRVRDFIAPHFERIDHDMEWWNVPPAQLYWGWKD